MHPYMCVHTHIHRIPFGCRLNSSLVISPFQWAAWPSQTHLSTFPVPLTPTFTTLSTSLCFWKKKKSNILSILGVFLNSCCLSPEHSALIPILQVSAPQRDGHLPPYSNFSLVLSTKVLTSFTVYLLILFLVCHRLHHQPMVIFLLSVCYLSCSKFPHSTKSVAMSSFLSQLQN